MPTHSWWMPVERGVKLQERIQRHMVRLEYNNDLQLGSASNHWGINEPVCTLTCVSVAWVSQTACAGSCAFHAWRTLRNAKPWTNGPWLKPLMFTSCCIPLGQGRMSWLQRLLWKNGGLAWISMQPERRFMTALMKNSCGWPCHGKRHAAQAVRVSCLKKYFHRTENFNHTISNRHIDVRTFDLRQRCAERLSRVAVHLRAKDLSNTHVEFPFRMETRLFSVLN